MKFMIACLQLCIVAWALAGCSSSLSGGSVPIGTIQGTVYLASEASTTVETAANVTVELIDPAGHVIRTVQTDNNGKFTFANLGQQQWRVRAKGGQGQQYSGEMAFELRKNEQSQVALILAPNFPDSVSSMALTPPSATMAVNESKAFHVALTTGSGPVTMPPRVSWAVRGSIGVITPDGVFTAKTPGEGDVIAQFRDGYASAHIIVTAPVGVSQP